MPNHNPAPIRHILESIARKLAECRERGLNTPDVIANQIGVELSNYSAIAGEFERLYASYARTRGERERCAVTHNPCGTDTWMAGRPCQCAPCQRYIAAGGKPDNRHFPGKAVPNA